jgi:hypothetical protein
MRIEHTASPPCLAHVLLSVTKQTEKECDKCVKSACLVHVEMV